MQPEEERLYRSPDDLFVGRGDDDPPRLAADVDGADRQKKARCLGFILFLHVTLFVCGWRRDVRISYSARKAPPRRLKTGKCNIRQPA